MAQMMQDLNLWAVERFREERALFQILVRSLLLQCGEQILVREEGR